MTDDLERTATLENAEKNLRSIKNNTRSFKAEIRLLPDPDERNRYKKELSSYEATVTQLTTELRGLRSEGNRQQLFIGAQTNGNTGTGDDPVATGDTLLDEAGRIQDKTQQSLFNTKTMIAESKQVGMQTAEELQRQREQLNTIDGDVMRMEDNLNRADKLIKTFGKRMATDKLIQCFACTNILLLVGVVVYVVVKGGFDGAKNDGAPESPVGDGGTTSEQTRMLRGAFGW
jgi:SNARE protein|eukprot:scaffold1887_cov267-Chaetoceros_neogracile.AAC.11